MNRSHNANFKFISNRDDVIEQAIEMLNETTSTLDGQGEDLDWIRLQSEQGDRLRTAFEKMLNRNVTIDFISAGKGTYAFETAQILEDYNLRYGHNLISVCFREYGQVRVLISDKYRMILAFRSGVSLDDQSTRYFGIYIESTLIGNWLTLRHKRLKNDDSVVHLDNSVNLLSDYNHYVRQFERLQDRKDFIKKMIELISNAQSSIILSGEQASWILDEELNSALGDAIEKAIKLNKVRDIRILLRRNDKLSKQSVKEYLAIAKDLSQQIGVERRHIIQVRQERELGQTRLAVIDKKHILLAFPITPQPRKRRAGIVREYNPFFVSSKEFAEWLSMRFDSYWKNANPRGESLTESIVRIPRYLWEELTESPLNLFVAVIGAFLLFFLGELLERLVRVLLGG